MSSPVNYVAEYQILNVGRACRCEKTKDVATSVVINIGSFDTFSEIIISLTILCFSCEQGIKMIVVVNAPFLI